MHTCWISENLMCVLAQVYYDYFSGHAHRGAAKGKNVTVPATLDKVPLLIRGGSVLATRERPRRSSPLMKYDPFTLTVALSSSGAARGELYLDDGVSYSHEAGDFVWREFVAATQSKTVRIGSRDLASEKPGEAVDGVALATYDGSNAFARDIQAVRVEKLVVLGLAAKPSSVKLAGGKELDWEYTVGVAAGGSKEGEASRLIVKNPGAIIAADWEIIVQL